VAKLVIGCGYVGRRVAALWRAQGQRVHATTRRPAEAAAFRADGVDPVICDVLDPASLAHLPVAETVLYAIGFDRASGASMRSVYVDGLANVLAHLPPPGRFIYVSSSSVYGQSDGGWVDEDAATEPEEESGKIVLAAEQVLRAKLPAAVILRFSGIYGPGRLLRQRAIEKGEPIVADADKWLNLIHVVDGARAILAAETHATPGRVYNICDDQPVRRRDFYAELARSLGAPSPRFVAPPSALGAGLPTPPLPHEKGNRRIHNGRMREELRVELRYAGFMQGLATSV
jgi:nucleoside-diphosphate-sugar epimerase